MAGTVHMSLVWHPMGGMTAIEAVSVMQTLVARDARSRRSATETAMGTGRTADATVSTPRGRKRSKLMRFEDHLCSTHGPDHVSSNVRRMWTGTCW